MTEVDGMVSAFSVLPIDGTDRSRRAYLDPRYPERRYTEQSTFSDGRVRLSALRGDRTLERVLDNFQVKAAMHSRYLQFTVQEDADIVQVIVRESNDEEKIIRKIPSDDIVRLIARRNEILGFLFDMVV
jgi:uncharacterized FlaG/YvyC family protein